MGILEQIQQMKNQGKSNEEIVRTLQQQGVSPKQINDALDQTKIKNAVSGGEDEQYSNEYAPSPDNDQYNYTPAQETDYNQQYAPQTQEGTYDPNQQYYQQGYENTSAETDTDTIIAIADQVFSEKIKKLQKKVEKINEFKVLAETEMENNKNRLKRIESIIDKLQISILEKIGSYGDNLQSIKNEMSMMQDSFGKVVNQAIKGSKSKKSSSSKGKTKSKK
ncbi:MAG: hypothetical protein P8X70_02485 [Nanoarchaeota archaeon]